MNPVKTLSGLLTAWYAFLVTVIGAKLICGG